MTDPRPQVCGLVAMVSLVGLCGASHAQGLPNPEPPEETPTVEPEDEDRAVAPIAEVEPRPKGPQAVAPPARAEDPARAEAASAERGEIIDEEEDLAEPRDASRVTEKKKKRKKPGRILKLYGRVMTGWEYENERPREGQPGEASDRQRFFLSQARVKAAAWFEKRIRLNVSIDLADAINPAPEPEINYLRNAHLTVKIHDAFRVRAGRFKRPFSRIELRSVNSIPFRGRGLSNDRVIEDLAWAERGIGMMLYGELDDFDDEAKIDWYLSASNPGLRVEGLDVHARLEVRPVKPLSLGANGAFKNVEDPVDPAAPSVNVWAYGADVRFKAGGLYTAVEGYAAADYRIAGRPAAGGVVGYVNYDVLLAPDWFLQPVVAAEWADANLEFSQSEAGRLVVGVNLLWEPALRILPQVEIIRPLGEAGQNPWLERETYYVMVTGEL